MDWVGRDEIMQTRLSTLCFVTYKSAKLSCITNETIHSVAMEAVDLLHIRELLRTMLDDLPWLEATVEEQIEQALLLGLGKHAKKQSPQLVLLYLVFCLLLFDIPDPDLYLFWTGVGP